MQFLKKNYEKIILGVVVLATLGLVAFLPIMVSQEKEKLNTLETNVTVRNPKALDPLDLSKEDEFIKRAGTTIALNLDKPHKVFNPVRWQSKNGAPFRNPAGEELDKLQVTKITPLMETYSLTGVNATEGLPTHYGIGIRHEAAATQQGRLVKTTYVEMNKTTNNFTVVEGGNDENTPVTLKLTDTGERVTITKDKPFSRPEGYMADMLYTPDNKPFVGRRKTDAGTICFANECYKIVDITEREVVLLQLSNQKTLIKELNPTN